MMCASVACRRIGFPHASKVLPLSEMEGKNEMPRNASGVTRNLEAIVNMQSVEFDCACFV